MSNLYDFVYCIDKNFNHQVYLSIASLLETNQTRKFSVNIIHKQPKTFNKYMKNLNKIFPEQELNLIEFKYRIKNYPNLKRAHVSEATYYRMFIEDHVQNPADFLAYIDADAYFLKDIDSKFINIIDNLRDKNLLIAAKTEFDSSNKNYTEVFERLDLDQKYFNAGVIIINTKKWKVDNISKNLKEKVFELNEKIKFWDQDVLNSIINGKYYELPFELNYLVDINFEENLEEKKVEIVHYAGKIKPWTKRGIKLNPNTYYQKLYTSYSLK